MGIQQQKFKILLIGDSCVDKYHYGVCDRISPEAPVPVFQYIDSVTCPGMSLNVKKNLEAFTNRIEIVLLTGEENIIKERYVDKVSGQHLLRVDSGDLNKAAPLKLNKKILEMIKSCDAMILSDYEKGFLDHHNCLALTREAKTLGRPVFVDTKKTDVSCFEGCFIKINQKEYELIDKKTLHEEQQIIVTCGKNGAVYKKKVFPSVPVDVIDVSGAGDTFLAVFAYKFLEHKDVPLAIESAVRASSYIVQKSGTYALRKEDVKNICI